MVAVQRSGTFDRWLKKLRDPGAVARINDKKSQSRDIHEAKRIAKEWRAQR